MSGIGGARVAVVHEWLLDYAGSERVAREILATFPGADLFTLVDRPDEELAHAIPQRAKATSFIHSLPNPRRWLRYYLPLMPLAIARLDVSAYDIVISSSHAVAKGVVTGPHQLHVSYVHSPMRYAWDLRDDYLRHYGLDRGLRGAAARWMLRRLREWDARSARGVHAFIANSRHVAGRIQKAYGREAEVLHPPVDTDAFALEERKSDYYVTVSRLEPYKRVDLLIEAFAAMPQRRLLVIGDGPQMRKLRARAGANVELAGYRSTEELRERMQKARAFLFAGIEDFGIVMAEAQACGTPVIAFDGGGAPEIVRTDTGMLFGEQSAAAIIDAVERFERDAGRFAPRVCRANAERFGRERFRAALANRVAALWQRFVPGRAATAPAPR